MNFANVASRWACAWILLGAPAVQAQAIALPMAAPALIKEAQEALRLKDKARLAAANASAQSQQHPLAAWVDYWDMGLRLKDLQQADLDAFYARWPGSYVEDRLRNDWLLELGLRRDWGNVRRELPRFKMADDREVNCYALVAEHARGRPASDLRTRALAAWLAQRDADDGCGFMAQSFLDAGLFKPADTWLKLRMSLESRKPRAVKQSAALLGREVEASLQNLQDNTKRYLARKASATGRTQAELSALALAYTAANDADEAADLLRQGWARRLPPDLAAWAWAQVGRQDAFKLQEHAADAFERALKLDASPDWSDDNLAWAARAALRADKPALLLQALQLMSASARDEPQWQYWRAHTLLASHPEQAKQQLQVLASPLSYYGKLAADDLQLKLRLPSPPAALSAHEKSQAFVHAGLNRALALISVGARNEGVREWNFSLRGMSDRELLAAAALACEREVWDRCINSSERAKTEIDLSQRYPTPYRADVLAKAKEIGLDAAYVYGLIRQESRFITDARSHVGASGLMQVMPATAQWTAKKSGLAYKPEFLTERDFNLKIGTRYLKLVLDDLNGSMPLAAAAYNAGPNRPRRWREGATLDAAVWVETIPFHETRDYVKKVISNATVYAELLGETAPTLRQRLGQTIGPRAASTPEPNPDLP